VPKPTKHRLLRAASWIAAFNCVCVTTTALADDSIKPYIGVTFASDDNVLGLGDESQYQRLVGRADGSDTTRMAQGGVNVIYLVSRQQFDVTAELSRTRYSYFKSLDYDGRNVKANWNWVVGDTLSGIIGTSNVRSLSRLSNFQDLSRNLRTDQQTFGNANWLLTPSWRLRVGVSSYDLHYDLASQRFANISENNVESGLSYVGASGNSVGLIVRRLDGKYPDRSLFTGKNESYQQNEAKANIDWHASGKSRVQAQFGWTSRDTMGLHPRSFSGPTARVTVDWASSGKALLNASVWKDVSAVDDVLASYSVNKGVSLSPAWGLTDKVVLRGDWRYEKRNFEGSAVPTFDTDRTTTASLTYTLTRSATLQATLFKFQREGNAYSGGYARRGASLSAQYTFNTLL
jgi:exopolysaccharide biosynthesis operon protein EpsL